MLTTVTGGPFWWWREGDSEVEGGELVTLLRAQLPARPLGPVSQHRAAHRACEGCIHQDTRAVERNPLAQVGLTEY